MTFLVLKLKLDFYLFIYLFIYLLRPCYLPLEFPKSNSTFLDQQKILV